MAAAIVAAIAGATIGAGARLYDTSARARNSDNENANAAQIAQTEADARVALARIESNARIREAQIKANARIEIARISADAKAAEMNKLIILAGLVAIPFAVVLSRVKFSS